MFGGRQFVIERYENAAGEKYGVGGNQPFGLIGHDDRRAISRGETGIFECRSNGLGGFAELAVGEAGFFRFAIRLDQANFSRPVPEGVSQRRSQRVEFCQFKHQTESH